MLYYFLSIQLICSASGLFASQQKHVDDLLHKFYLHTVKPVSTPSLGQTPISFSNSELLPDPSNYRNMVSALQYLMITQPNIAYAVHVVF